MIKQEQFIWEEGTQELKGIYWDYRYNPPLQRVTKLQIIFTKHKEIQYFRDGSRLRIEQIKDTSKKPEILNNIEQILYLQWSGKYKQNIQKIGKWIAKWNGQIIQDAGGYYSDKGNKTGFWKELYINYWTEAQVYEEGEYNEGLRTGYWKQIFNAQLMGHGQYNIKGQKCGKWVELWEGFWRKSQVKQVGEYKNGKKVGIWDFEYRDSKIGGGSYEEGGDGVKIGRWIDLDDTYDNSTLVTHIGVYKNGKKVGLWKTFEKQSLCNIIYIGEFEKGKKVGIWDIYWIWNGNQIIGYSGGGAYDDKGNGLKIGKWIDLDDEFNYYYQVIHKGEYKNGHKVGRWEMQYKDDTHRQFSTFGGGSYDQGSDGIKVGKWVELDQKLDKSSQVIHCGEYKNGKKVGRWEILQKEDINQGYSTIGGGSYNEVGEEFKIGKWIDLDDNFENSKQVTYNGEYKNSKKVGKWDIKYYNEQIGGGQYDDQGDGAKIGKWIDLDSQFNDSYQVTHDGEYKNGKKVGRWDIKYRDEKSKVFATMYKILYTVNYSGGGQYHEGKDGTKIGKWIDLDDKFENSKQVTYNGEYKNGKKVGKWDIEYRDNSSKQFSKIGGGQYDQGSDEIKIGKWIDLDERFYLYNQVTYNGEYKNGKKVGRWDIEFRDNSSQLFYKIGGGSYDDRGDGVKIGKWIELDEGFYLYKQVIHNGDYNNGKKVGKWMEMKREWKLMKDGFKKVNEQNYEY
ncbi:unnamed protein product [Paramecium pentaurelia]|uniref:Uncharacterized protein n=1 Tax=Paramecium pentaurelia TaxID=43138 RepID=A0A8S1SPI7_9CILI|nr:unnamed protein product [Paramecium pentaurelia]